LGRKTINRLTDEYFPETYGTGGGFGEMDFLSDDAHSVVNPIEMVRAFTGSKGVTSQDLFLESLALITFTSFDQRDLTGEGRAKKIGAWRNRSNQIYRGEGWVAIQSPNGAPNTVMLLEEMIAFGVKRAICLGYCGSIQKTIKIGNIIIPTEAVREEGTSYHYLPEGERSMPDLILQNQLFFWMKEICPIIHMGKVWTTDAPYRETPKKISQYHKGGILGVEMEMSAAFAIGMVREISIGSILIVSDEIGEAEWNIGFFAPSIKTTRAKVIKGILTHLKEMIPK
jgi:uridine phosphorylase